MRFLTSAVALFASLALAQQNAILVPENQSTLDITAGEPVTIQWTNPSSSTVTIKLQQSNGAITPESGITLASGIPASDGTATFTIDPSEVNSFQYTIEIIDDTNANNYNFSPNFGITGATGTAVASASTASATGSTTATVSDSSTATDSTSSATTSGSSSTGSATTTTDSTSSESTSSSTSSAASETTSAPSSENGASSPKAQAGLLALIAGAVAFF